MFKIQNHTMRVYSKLALQRSLFERNKINIVKNVTGSTKGDIIGPADSVSNLRPIIRFQAKNETKLEKQLRTCRDATQAWNQNFWKQHNIKFFKERKEYIAANLPKSSEKSTLTADEMSVFYKSFLDRNWKLHLEYNIEWYKKNFKLLIMEICVNIINVFKKR